MSFQDRYGSTQIINRRVDNLSISFDCGTRRFKVDEVGVVLLFTPDMSVKGDHYHIEITREEAINLKEWLDLFLKNKDILKRYNKDMNQKPN